MVGFPFDSLTGTLDRAVNSDIYADMMRYKYESGVFPQDVDGCKVTAANSGLDVNVNIGHALVRGRFKNIDEIVTLTPTAASSTLPRIDRVILRMDNTISVRDIVPMILSGTPNASPQPPALTLTENIYDISLGQIYIDTGATTITDANITDERTFCVIPVNMGGTGSTTVAGALANLNGIEKTTANITYYVSPTGSNTNNGLTALTPFATAAYALSKLPKYIAHTVTINFAVGTYTEPRIMCRGFIGDGEIIFFASNTSSSDYFLTYGISFEKNTCKISCKGLSASSNDTLWPVFDVDTNPGSILFYKCSSNNTTGGARDGFASVESPSVRCDNCWANNHIAGFVTGHGGIITVYECDATNSDTGLYCVAGLIMKYGGNISGTVSTEIVHQGGIIVRNSGAILGTS